MNKNFSVTYESIPDSMDFLNEEAAINTTELFNKVLKNNTFVCEICRKTIIPKITINEHEIFVENSRTEIRGGLGNKVRKKNVCSECAKHMAIFTNERHGL